MKKLSEMTEEEIAELSEEELEELRKAEEEVAEEGETTEEKPAEEGEDTKEEATPTPNKKPKEVKVMEEDDEESMLKQQLFAPTSDEEEGIVTTDIDEDTTVNEIMELFDEDINEEYSDKYQKELSAMAEEDPTSVMIETPEGWMTLASAMKEGFNPESGQFDGESIEERIDKIIQEQGLEGEEAARIKEMVLRGQAPMPEQEAMPMEGEEMPVEGEEEIDPGMLAALGGM